jgi:cytochrome c oxidase subunit 2
MGDLPFFPVEASTIAGNVDLLMAALISISCLLTSGVVALIAYFSIKYRRGNAVDRSNPTLSSNKIEFSWIFGLLILSVGTFTWATILYFRIFRPPENPLEIYVVGQQWMWKFQHTEGPREINELHIPKDRPIRVIMTSQDVIHSFYVPAFRVKYDVIPGRYTSIWFEPTKTGTFHIFCAEYCGTQHSEMIGSVIVMEQREYADWLSGVQVGAPIAQSGEQLFSQLGCSNCHAPGTGNIGPSLVGLFGEPVPLQSGETVIADENYIRESILFPKRKIVAGYDPVMPSYEGQISEEQLLQLVEFIKSIGSGSQGAPAHTQAPNEQPQIQPTP